MEETDREFCLENERVQESESQPGAQEDGEESAKPTAAFEGIYDRLPDISVKSVDRFIIICVIALIAVVVIGILRARHVI